MIHGFAEELIDKRAMLKALKAVKKNGRSNLVCHHAWFQDIYQRGFTLIWCVCTNANHGKQGVISPRPDRGNAVSHCSEPHGA